jgi:hypothetical protein
MEISKIISKLEEERLKLDEIIAMLRQHEKALAAAKPNAPKNRGRKATVAKPRKRGKRPAR